MLLQAVSACNLVMPYDPHCNSAQWSRLAHECSTVKLHTVQDNR